MVDHAAESANTQPFVPSNIAAFKADAANTNDDPVYLGRFMLFSDQDMVSLKHNLIGNTIVSTVFVGMLSTISNPAIPMLMRMLLVAVMVTGTHAIFVGVWNLIQSFLQLHKKLHPDPDHTDHLYYLTPGGMWSFVKAKNMRLVMFGVMGFNLVQHFLPTIGDAVDSTRRVMGF